MDWGYFTVCVLIISTAVASMGIAIAVCVGSAINNLAGAIEYLGRK